MPPKPREPGHQVGRPVEALWGALTPPSGSSILVYFYLSRITALWESDLKYIIQFEMYCRGKEICLLRTQSTVINALSGREAWPPSPGSCAVLWLPLWGSE